MKIPTRVSSYKKIDSKIKYFVIHDINCRYLELPKFTMDSTKPLTNELRVNNYLFYDEYELPFHFMVEQIKDTFEVVLCRPLTVQCKFENMDPKYSNALHIGIMGSATYQIPSQHLYKIMAMKIFMPYMSAFRIPLDNILLHNEIDDKSDCPGNFFNKKKLYSSIKEMMPLRNMSLGVQK